MSENPRNVTVHGRRTSMRLEPELWEALEGIAARNGATLHQVCTAVESGRRDGQSRTSAVRAFIVRNLRLQQAAE